ncbi:arsenate reductase (glutaredoxin) [Parashewanella curva]|uniref:Arsenate reductase n=1 Tax=Parashewanella curva TaxID=2338552 RepID=A0A3L8Q0W4_9GAMM|nr:arsenate reductase (glutaredoxin) [Parashewanella curva]RLV61225.1 arsenate reductase (glutaredoxin) [Parashewanella curva]
MTKVTIFHNPRCSKSRQTLALLQENNCEIEIIEYLKDVPTVATLKNIHSLLGVSVREMMRTKEDDYKQQNLADSSVSDDLLFEAMTVTPKIIERPIVLANNKAVIGRPPENVLDII